MDFETAEGIARWVLEGTGLDDPPVDAFQLAAMCGVDAVARAGIVGALAGDTIHYDPRLPPRVQQAMVCHELGHWAAIECGEESTETAAILISHALMLPRRHFWRDMTRTWRIDELQRQHRNASASWIARRVVQLSSMSEDPADHATATIVDNGRIKERLASPWLPEAARRRPTAWERALISTVTETGRPARTEGRGWAVPVQSARVHRVVLVAESREVAAA